MTTSPDRGHHSPGADDAITRSRKASLRARAIRLRTQKARAQLDSPRPPLLRLSPREREVLALLSLGLTTKSLAAKLGISLNTAGYHLANIYRKLGVHSRVEAANAYFGRVR